MSKVQINGVFGRKNQVAAPFGFCEEAAAMTPITTLAYADNEARFAAIAARDKAADGLFWCCVVTTKIYCRPSCAARPLPGNIRFVTSTQAARHAGFRACKRCRPDAAQPAISF